MRFFAVLFLVLTLACSTSRKTFEQHLAAGSCEQAAASIPENTDPGIRLLSTSQQAGGTVASYAITGASYGVQILWDIAGTTAMAIILCDPFYILQMKSSSPAKYQYPSPDFVPCFTGKVTALNAPPLGKNAYRNTETLRCSPDLNPLSQSVRKVAQCFENSGKKEDLLKAKQDLSAIRYSGEFFQCLSEKEQVAVEEELKSMERKLNSTD